MGRWAKYIGEFFGDMFHHWTGQVTGGLSLVTVCAPLIWPRSFAGDKGLPLSRALFFSISAVAFFFASLSAWLEKKEALRKTEEAWEDAIDINRPEVTAEFNLITTAAYMHGGPQVQIVNRGSSDAWHIHIQDVFLAGHRVSFHCPSILEKGQTEPAPCFISGIDINSANNLEGILYQQAIGQCREDIYGSQGPDINPDSFTVIFDLSTTWRDSRGNGFSSTGKVAYEYKKPLRTAKTEFPLGILRMQKPERISA